LYISDVHISYLHIFKNAAPMNSMHSVRKMFHRTERCMKPSCALSSWISVSRLG
jgi:hypothetical protein